MISVVNRFCIYHYITVNGIQRFYYKGACQDFLNFFAQRVGVTQAFNNSRRHAFRKIEGVRKINNGLASYAISMNAPNCVKCMFTVQAEENYFSKSSSIIEVALRGMLIRIFYPFSSFLIVGRAAAKSNIVSLFLLVL